MQGLLIFPLFIGALISAALAILVWSRRPAFGAQSFTALMLSLTVWALSTSLHLVISIEQIETIWLSVAQSSVVFMPTLWLVFSLQYTRRQNRLAPSLLALLALEPLAALILIWTNPSHNLFWVQVHSALNIRYGLGFWLHILYSYLLLLMGSLVLIQRIFRSPKLPAVYALALLVGILTPWGANLLFILGESPYSQVDLTPITFLLTSPLLAWGLFRFRIFNNLPVAYEDVIENMHEGVVIFDERNRVVALNPAGERILAWKSTDAIGQPAEKLFGRWPHLANLIHRREERSAELSVGEGQQRKYYKIRLSRLHAHQSLTSGLIAILHEFTEHRRSQEALKRRTEELACLNQALLDITLPEELPSLSKTILEEAQQLVNASAGVLYLSRPERRELFCAYQINFPQIEIGSTLRLNEGAAGIVAQTGVALRNEQGGIWPGRTSSEDTIENTTGTLTVPIRWQGLVTGVIHLQRFSPDPVFSETDLDLLTIFANQVGIVQENTRLLQAERRQRKRAQTLREVATILTASLERKQVLNLILEQLERVLDYDSASVMLTTGEKLSIVAHRKFHSPQQEFTPLEVDALPHVKEVLEERSSVIIKDTRSDPRWQYLSKSGYIRCWMGVPLIGQNRVLGLLNLDKEEAGYYNQADAELAEAFASQAAIAIENVRLFEAAQRQAQEAETLRQATSVVLSTLNQDEAINRILVQLERVVPFDSASVQLLVDGNLEVVGGSGWSDEKPIMGMRFPVPGDNPNTVVVQERHAYILGNAAETYTLFQEEPYRNVRSWLGVPLIVHNRVLGILALASIQADYFTEKHARLVSAFADQVVVAIENARLYAAERQRVEESDALRATIADISSELELPKLLQAVLKRAATLLNAQGGELGLFRKDKNAIEIVASYNLGEDFSGKLLAIGEGAMGKAAEDFEPVIIDDYSQWQGRSLQYPQGPWHGVIAVPMQIGGRLVGAIDIVDFDEKRKFSASDQRLLSLFAQQAAIAVENARLYQSTREAADRRAVLHKVSQEIVAVRLDPETIYTAIHQAAGALMPTEAFAITLYDKNSASIEAVYLIDQQGRSPNQRFPADRGISGRIVQSGKSIYIPDMLEELGKVDAVHFGDPVVVRSILAVPMRLGGEITGMLSAQSYDPDAYTPDDQRLLEMLAAYAAIALDNSRLLKEVQRLAITDSLTEIYNRRHLFELGQREFSRARRFDRTLTVMMLDIDYFKRVNDTFGHAMGDQILFELCQRLREGVRDVDILGRYGGEEFTIILPETEIPAARKIAERLRRRMRTLKAKDERQEIPITISIGIAAIKPETSDIHELIADADAALLKAKQSGRNRIATE
ncbi:MAG: GAF domain-containing protein [Anaerolineales bacterium]